MLADQKGSVLTMDAHGMRSDDAKRQLERLLSRTGRDVREIVVIHGCNHRQVLKSIVRLELKHARIQSKLASLNEEQTRPLLKER